MDRSLSYNRGESLVSLLCAAYAVEQKSLDALREQELVSDSGFQKRIRAHVVETQWQKRLLGACLEFQGIDKDFIDEEVHKFADSTGRLVDLFSIKRFEIDLYKKIIAAARVADAPEVLQACREILEQERAMAEWIEDNEKRPEAARAVS
jgi:ferritin-like metal-binding protein YciE